MPKEIAQADVESNSGRDQLMTIVERIETLDEEKSQTADAIKDVYAEAKGNGYDVATLRLMIKRRKMDRDKLREQDQMLELYEGIFA